MDLAAVKEQLTSIAMCFYQERIKDGLDMLEEALKCVLSIPEFGECIAPLMDSIEQKDYVLAADIFYYEMAMRIQ